MAFDCYIRRAIEEDKVIFPNMFCKTEEEKDDALKKGIKLKSLEAERHSMQSIYRFMCQFFNDPIDESTVEFKRNYIERISFSEDVIAQLKREKALISIDPAVRIKETNDKTGIIVSKPLRKAKKRIILEAIGRRMSIDKLVDEIFRLVQIYDTERVLVETFLAQLWLVKILKEEMIKRGVYFTITEVRGSTREDKAARIRGLIPYYANGRVAHRNGLDDLEAELLQFPRSKHDDIIDALAYQIAFWKDLNADNRPLKSKLEPFSLDWFKTKLPDNRTDRERIFKGIAKRRPGI